MEVIFMNKPFALMALTAAMAAPAALASTPVMFSSIDNFNTPDANQVAGVRLSALHGKVNEVKGVDFSILGLSETDKTTGVNFGLFFGASKVNQEMTGASLGLLNWNTGNTYGANLGFVNLTHDVKGANLSFVNYSEGNTLVDLGAANFSNTSTVQFGLFNKTEKIEGVQIGLLNCADNGFFKCFPIINFAK
ncbi:phaC PHA synthase [Vibrio cholerae]|uniref:PhaC PHA synthase n=2 Tax=Vibrio cholerae TaxID=666 RepID=A0A5B1C3W5_VIBCL|nr:phaC PHA synthase [Vibrio cholerae]EGR1701928.1 phaC PHA synthase [Vibrio cholerae]EGR4156430.1 phaC PHA synthase [Vibrio cholerae]EGR4207490.1 phaC PHA synthase [Vibrio cholerae]EGR4400548.1 phaC PHA synthase [Vibrio cholerae]